jgi:hypothetical protein
MTLAISRSDTITFHLLVLFLDYAIDHLLSNDTRRFHKAQSLLMGKLLL